MKRALCIACMASLCLMARTQESVLTDTLGQQLIIAHSKYPTAAKTASKSFIVIEKEQIQLHGVDNISTLLDRQVGIIVAGARSNYGKDKSLFIQGASGEFTLILIDGLPVTDPSGIGGSFDLRNLSLNEVERIEIIKGGQSSLYGSDAMAAVVNIITKRKKGAATASIGTSLGSFGTRSLDASLGIGDEQLSIKASASHFQTDGISEALDEGNVGFDNDPSNRLSVSGSVQWKPIGQLTFRPFIRYSDFEGDFDGGAFTDSEDDFSSKWANWGIKSELEFGNGQVDFSYSKSSTDRTFNSAQFGASVFRGRFQTAEIFTKLGLGAKGTLLGGLNYQLHKMKDDLVDPNPSATIVSPFASFQYAINAASAFEIGLRYNHHETFGGNLNYSFGGSHWLNNQLKAFIQYSTSFKAPNLFQLFGQFGANLDLNPQKGRSINLGLSYDGYGHLDRVGVEFFNRSVSDLISFAFPEGYINLDQQNDFGLECSGGFVINKTRLGLSYTYLFGELQSGTSNLDIENLLRRPKHQLDAQIQQTIVNKADLGLNVRYTGTRPDIFFNNTTFSNESVMLNPYWLIDLSISYPDIVKGINLTLQINNLTDEKYQEIAGFSTQNRNYSLSLRWSLAD